MLAELFYYAIISYLVYKGILFIARFFASPNKKGNSNPVSPKSSRFKDIEEANYTEIKDDKDKDKDKDKDPH
jgi:hypothetical protein